MKRWAKLEAVGIVALSVGMFGETVVAQTAIPLVDRSTPPATTPGASGAAAPARGYLGAELDDEGEQGKGVRVTRVRPGTPAEASGLKAGDLITGINGSPITNLDGYDAVAVGPPGTRLQMMVDRGGRGQQLTVTLGNRPATPPAGGATAPGPLGTEATEPKIGGEEPQLGAPSLSGPGTTVPAAPGAPSLSPAGESLLPAAPALGAPAGPDTTPLPNAPSPAPGGAGGSFGGGIRAQPLELGSPPPAARQGTSPSAGGPSSEPASGGNASLGVSVQPLSEQLRARLGVPVRRGAYVADVKRGSSAEQAGIAVGTVIVRYDARPIETDHDLVNAVRASRPGQDVELSFYEGNRLHRKAVRLAAAGATAATDQAGPGSASGGGDFGGGYGGRPLTSRVDRTPDHLTRPPPVSTVWNPQQMADLQQRIRELTDAIQSLEARLGALEARSGGGSSSPPARPGSLPSAPSFGAPGAGASNFGTPNLGTPSFGAPGGSPTTSGGNLPALGPITNP